MDTNTRRRLHPFMTLPVAIALTACTGDGGVPSPEAAGAPEEPATTVLEAGARVLQDTAPVEALDLHLVGFHPMKDTPHMQMEAHHFCRQVNEDFAQCALFDGTGADANLTGVEYIISEAAFGRLPEAERAYWHPHNAEILSGQLVAPGIPHVAEQALMRQKINSYGKTWHTWHTRHGLEPGDAMPLGPAQLAWSFNRDGELDPALLAARDWRMDIDTAALRERRQELRSLAQPQSAWTCCVRTSRVPPTSPACATPRGRTRREPRRAAPVVCGESFAPEGAPTGAAHPL